MDKKLLLKETYVLAVQVKAALSDLQIDIDRSNEFDVRRSMTKLVKSSKQIADGLQKLASVEDW